MFLLSKFHVSTLLHSSFDQTRTCLFLCKPRGRKSILSVPMHVHTTSCWPAVPPLVPGQTEMSETSQSRRWIVLRVQIEPGALELAPGRRARSEKKRSMYSTIDAHEDEEEILTPEKRPWATWARTRGRPLRGRTSASMSRLQPGRNRSHQSPREERKWKDTTNSGTFQQPTRRRRRR